MEGIEDITDAAHALFAAINDPADDAVMTRPDRFDRTLRVMTELGRIQARIEAARIDTLNQMLTLADTQLPDGAEPGAVRHHAGDQNDSGGGDRWLHRAEIASVELGFATGISPASAMTMLYDATRAAETFTASVDLLRQGGMRPAQYRALTELTQELTDDQAARVQEAILARGTDCSNRLWRDRVRRAVRRVLGTNGLTAKRRKSAQDRYLRFGQPGLDGMSPVYGLMPALDAAEADAALTWAAGTASAGDSRTLDQRRVDAFVTILRGPCSFTRPDADDPDAPRLDEDLITINVTGEEEAEVAGVWDRIRSLASRINLTIPRVPERLIEITVPAHVLAGADLHVGDDGTTAPGSGPPGRDGPPDRGPRDDDPGEASDTNTCSNDGGGSGPLLPEARIGALGVIDGALARRLARDGRWRRIITDPQTGAPTDIGTRTYRPPAAMRRRVRKRDRTCRAPGCTRTAWLDLDHVDPWHADGSGGATSDANLEGLCKRHHLAKHQLRWRVISNPDGSITWIRGQWRHTTWPDTTEDP